MVDIYFPNKKNVKETQTIYIFGITIPLLTYDSFRLIKTISKNLNKLFRNLQKPRFGALNRMDHPRFKVFH